MSNTAKTALGNVAITKIILNRSNRALAVRTILADVRYE